MKKTFNTEGYCDPELHYMVDLSERLNGIKAMVDAGKYFTINRARQYGKTTTLHALAGYLQPQYLVISLDFQGLSFDDFQTEAQFAAAFTRQILLSTSNLSEEVRQDLTRYADGQLKNATLSQLFYSLIRLCQSSEKEVVLLIDLETPPRLSSAAGHATHSENASRLGGAEVDSASNNQVFIDFLAQLRFYYLKRRTIIIFRSVILAGVYDIRNIKGKIRPEEEHKENSPWNIAADFNIDMDFSKADIAHMLTQYETDNHTGMGIDEIADLVYSYTSGYPYLVSRLCKFIDERIPGSDGFPDKSSAWTRAGTLKAVKLLENESNSLFQSLKRKLKDYPELRLVLYDLLFTGKPIPYSSMNDSIEIAAMFGFVKNQNGTAIIANRIFETVLYNWFISNEYTDSRIYNEGALVKNQFIAGGHLNVRKVLEKFVESFDDLYGDREESFIEDVGRRYFMLFLKPIINGEGNSYVEAETRNQERTDLVIDYHGEQFIIELKIWRGNAYNERGENQLLDYLEHFHLKKGYMLSFCFNKKKQIGLKEIVLGDKVLIEAIV